MKSLSVVHSLIKKDQIFAFSTNWNKVSADQISHIYQPKVSWWVFYIKELIVTCTEKAIIFKLHCKNDILLSFTKVVSFCCEIFIEPS